MFPMVWFYKRHRVSLSLETRYDNETSEYVAVVTHPDGRQQTERFDRRELFRAWLDAYEEQLIKDNWASDGPPHIVPDGWPDKPPLM